MKNSKMLMSAIAMLLSTITIAAPNDLTPPEYLGKYVPKSANCQTSDAMVLVGKHETTLKLKQDQFTRKHEQSLVYYGGARATDTLALIGDPIGSGNDRRFAFIVGFHDGIIELDIVHQSIKQRFGTMAGLLKKCQIENAP